MNCGKKLLSSFAVVCMFFAITVFTSGISYGMNHSGNITSNQTWHATDNPHIVTGDVSVHSGAILTIEPGCLVKFDAGKGLLIGNVNDGDATLNAVGTNGKPITFTSNGSPPAAGDWDGSDST